MQPYPFFSKIILLTFFVKNCSAISTREICDENDCSRENDLWLKCARERCNVTSQGGAWSLVIFLGQTCPQTWSMRTMSDLTCISPVRMCNHSLDIYIVIIPITHHITACKEWQSRRKSDVKVHESLHFCTLVPFLSIYSILAAQTTATMWTLFKIL